MKMKKFYRACLIAFIAINLYFFKEISCTIYDIVGEGGEFAIAFYWMAIMYLPAIEWKKLD